MHGILVIMAMTLSQPHVVQDWTAANGRYVLETKPEPWKAIWIGPGPELRADVMAGSFFVRKRFKTDDPARFRRVYVCADSQYKLWVNGKAAAFGPARFDPMHQVYDTLDLSDLIVPGENVIAVQVMCWGEKTSENPFHLMSIKPAFLLESADVSTDATWRVLISAGHATAGALAPRKELGGTAGNWFEKVDARQVPPDWMLASFEDDGWPMAHRIARVEIRGERADTSTPWEVIARAIPGPEMKPAEQARALQSGVVEDRDSELPFTVDVTPDGAAPTLPVTFPGDGKVRYLVFDAGRDVNAFVNLDLEASAGAQVEVMYAETPSLNGARGRRDQLEDKRVEGCCDVYIARDGRQVFEPFLHRTFWYVRVAVKSDAPVTIHGLRLNWAGYPFTERGSFHCSDPTLDRIWQMGWYTQRMCAFDTYYDCPYFERLQYAGDTRIQALVSYYASGDARLAANAIRQLHASVIPEGLTRSRYPTNVFQVIPGYSLCWVQMLEDYYQHTGDISLVHECANVVQSVLRCYEDHRNARGFISDMPYWNFYDWTYEHSGVPDAHKENCTLSTIHYKGTLDAAARLFDALGEPEQAALYRAHAEEIRDRVNAQAWNEQEGLYTDGIETKALSQHVNTFAVLYGIADAQRTARIAKRLFDDPALRGTTFYFAHYLHEAAIKLGQPERILQDLERWKLMLDAGTSTWWETPENPRSECHAWSATPTYRLMAEVLGVKPETPGFARVTVQPVTLGLAFAEGVVPTPHGDIRVRWDSAPKFTLKLTIPEGVTADVTLPDGTQREAGPGEHTLSVTTP